MGPDADKVLAADFAALAETMAQAAGMQLESENKAVPLELVTGPSPNLSPLPNPV